MLDLQPIHFSSKFYLIKGQRKRSLDELKGDLKKIRLPVFYGEVKTGEGVESMLLEMSKYTLF